MGKASKKKKAKGFQTTAYSLLTIAVVVLSIATYQRNTVWHDEITLWEDVVKKSPNKARGYNNLGNLYMDKNR